MIFKSNDPEIQSTITSVVLEVQGAMFDMIVPSLRAVCFAWEEKSETSRLVFFHDGEVNDDLFDLYSTIESDATCVPWGKYIKSNQLVITPLKYPKPIPEQDFFLTIYHRKEPFEDPK